jgi:ribosomal 50S subunit-recycling heat shock protein
MDIEIVVIGESGKRVLSDSLIRIGQDPNCEVSLQPGKYPAVAGVHLTLEVINGAVSLARGAPLGGETFVNGHPAAAGATIRSGDILRLGAGGPEIRIRLLEQEAYAQPPVAHEPTRILNEPTRAQNHEPTRILNEPTRALHEPTRIISGTTPVTYSSASPVAPAAAGRQGFTTEVARGVSAAPRPTVQQPAASAAEGEDMSILEGKVKSLQSILVISLLILLVLLGCNAWQSWELYQTRDEVQQLRAQAANAVTQLTPALDQRLGVFEQRLDGMDAKVAEAQDRMVKTMDAQTKREEDRLVDRMNTAIPAMLDKYIAGKVAQARQ